MNKKISAKLMRRNALSALVVGLGIIALTDAPTTATPIKDDFTLAQVGVGRTISSPIPLNLRPHVHIPLPQSNYSSYPDDRHDRHDRYDRHDFDHGDHSNRGTIIIINPDTQHRYDRFTNYSDRGYIRVIRNGKID